MKKGRPQVGEPFSYQGRTLRLEPDGSISEWSSFQEAWVPSRYGGIEITKMRTDPLIRDMLQALGFVVLALPATVILTTITGALGPAANMVWIFGFSFVVWLGALWVIRKP